MSAYRVHIKTWQGEYIEGTFLMTFIQTGMWNGIPQFSLTPIYVFRDGTIDCWDTVTFEEFKQKVRAGRIVTQPPENAEITVQSVGIFTLSNATYEMGPEDLILEVADEIEALNRRPTSSQRCRSAWTEYEANPNGKTKEALRLAYEAVPQHNRKYILGDQDRKDEPIRLVLYSD